MQMLITLLGLAIALFVVCILIVIALYAIRQELQKISDVQKQRVWIEERQAVIQALMDAAMWCGAEYPVLEDFCREMDKVVRGVKGFSPDQYRDYIRNKFPTEQKCVRISA
jgi:hypothetical protein